MILGDRNVAEDMEILDEALDAKSAAVDLGRTEIILDHPLSGAVEPREQNAQR